jgi:CheY-like chemotaxis protein
MGLLGRQGHEVWGTYSGEQALEAVSSFDPHVVFIDIGLPDMTGYQVAQRIRARARGPGMRLPLLIGVSGGYTRGGDRTLAEVSGLDHYLLKPYDFEDVLRLLAPLSPATPPASRPVRKPLAG